MSKQTAHNALRRLWLMIATLALAIRVLVPTGFMLVPTDAMSGYLKITLCSADGNRDAFMAPDGSIHGIDGQDGDEDGNQDNKSMEHGACAFAGSAGYIAAPLFQAGVSLNFRAAPILQHTFVLDLVPGRGLAAPPPPATASPILI